MAVDKDKLRRDGYMGYGFNNPGGSYNYDPEAKRSYDQGVKEKADFERRIKDYSDSFKKKDDMPISDYGNYSPVSNFLGRWAAHIAMMFLIIMLCNGMGLGSITAMFFVSIISGLLITIIRQNIGKWLKRLR